MVMECMLCCSRSSEVARVSTPLALLRRKVPPSLPEQGNIGLKTNKTLLNVLTSNDAEYCSIDSIEPTVAVLHSVSVDDTVDSNVFGMADKPWGVDELRGTFIDIHHREQNIHSS